MKGRIEADHVLTRLRLMADRQALAGMARFGIKTSNALGVSIPKLRKFARDLGRNHALALELWESGIHEAQCLAAMVDEPEKVTDKQMERWVRAFDSWDTCDVSCGNLFDRTLSAFRKAVEWTRRDEEYVKRAGFVLMAVLAVHDKTAPDSQFLEFLPIIRRESGDDRNFVKKAVNWALRQIGKRNLRLNREAIRCAQEIRQIDTRSARWIAADALRELNSEAVQQRIRRGIKP